MALDQWIKYKDKPNETVLTIDAENFKEFERQIGVLKEALDNLVPLARDVFEEIEEGRLAKKK